MTDDTVTDLLRIARHYRPGISYVEIVLLVKRRTPFFLSLTGEMPRNPRTRRDADTMDRLAHALGVGP